MQPARELVQAEDPEPADFWRWVWESVRPVLGWVLTAVGLIAILIGWYGVSGEALVAKQLPFLASGGLLGIALVVLGARFLLIQDLRRDAGRLDRIETMVNELHAALLARPDAPGRVAGATAVAKTSANGAASYVVLPGGQSFHRGSCPMLEGKEKTSTIRSETVARRGLTPCPLCEPTSAAVEA
jgi:hypothetical protein